MYREWRGASGVRAVGARRYCCTAKRRPHLSEAPTPNQAMGWTVKQAGGGSSGLAAAATGAAGPYIGAAGGTGHEIPDHAVTVLPGNGLATSQNGRARV